MGQQPLGNMSLSGGGYPNLAYLLSLIGAILIMLGALYYIIIALAFASIFGAIGFFGGYILVVFGVVGLVFGLIILLLSFRLKRNPAGSQMTGILILVFSLISFIGDGFYIGSVLALIGGILALIWKPTPGAPQWGQPQQQAWGQPGQQWGQPPQQAPPYGAPPPGAAPMAGQKFCPSCGSPNAPGAGFCAKCGAAMPP
jgi:hypothetical protein